MSSRLGNQTKEAWTLLFSMFGSVTLLQTALCLNLSERNAHLYNMHSHCCVGIEVSVHILNYNLLESSCYLGNVAETQTHFGLLVHVCFDFQSFSLYAIPSFLWL